MLFSREEIESVLEKTDKNVYQKLTSDHPNYIAVVDYLTGQTQTLQNIQQGPVNHQLSVLTSLLEENLDSPKSRRLTEVFAHHNIYPNGFYAYVNQVIQFLIRVNTKDYLQSVLSVFQKANYTRLLFFSSLVAYFDKHRKELFSGPVCLAPVAYQFLTSSLQVTPKFIHPVDPYGNQYPWNAFFFSLLEDVKPEWISDYIRVHTLWRAQTKIPFLASYKEGAYLPVFLSVLTEPDQSDTNHLYYFEDILQVYDLTGHKYLTEAANYAEKYVALHRKKYDPKGWESCYKLQELDRSFNWSACAFHLLFLQDRPKAISLLQQWQDEKKPLPVDTIRIAFLHLKNEAIPFFKKTLTPELADSQYVQRLLEFTGTLETQDYLAELWVMTGSRSKPIREMVARILVEKDTGAEDKALKLLDHKKMDTRNTAVLILSQIDTPRVKEAMMNALDKETNDVSRDLLLETIAPSLAGTMGKEEVRKIISSARNRDKLNKPITAFIDESSLPELFYIDGEKLQLEELRFFLYRMSRSQPNRVDREASCLLSQLDRSTAGPFAAALLKLYLDNGSAPEQKYLLTAAALLSNEAQVDTIRLLVDKWVEAGRYKMAEYGIAALALQGSNKAMRWVEWYSRKYSSKKANVGAAALAALEAAAEQQGITLHELGDRLVPDFGFNGLFKTFTAGGDEYRAFIDSKFKLTFFNEDNKKLKSLPASATEEQKQEFKTVTKEVREIVKSQSSRLEYYLVTQRKWTFAQWQLFFLNNPIMFIYATKLLWGVYENETEKPPVQTFLCEEDTTLLDHNDEEISPGPEKYIGIVHPAHLEAPLLKSWQEKFFDRDITAIFPQLDRKQTDLSAIDGNKTILLNFEGHHMKTGSIRSTLDNKGWQKGPTGDGGFIESYRLIHRAKKLEVVLELEGVGAGFGWGAEEKLGRLYIVDKDKVRQRWFYPKDEKDESLVPLKDLPTIFLHEMLAAIDSIPLNNP